MIKPLNNKVLLKPVEIEKLGKIDLPEHMKIRRNEFTVISSASRSTKFKTGDTVVIHEHCGVPIEHNGEKFRLVDARELLGVVKDGQ